MEFAHYEFRDFSSTYTDDGRHRFSGTLIIDITNPDYALSNQIVEIQLGRFVPHDTPIQSAKELLLAEALELLKFAAGFQGDQVDRWG